MIDFLLQIAWETWYILKEAALFLLLGFSIAGILAVLVPGHTLLRFFGRGKVKSVLWASTLGIPLPLCSCGVLPTAIGLRRQGATKGATVSFLISTPETGIDSISLSYALMDPLITVFRPLAAIITAISAGLATNFFGESRKSTAAAGDDSVAAAAEQHLHEHHHGHDHHGHDDHHHEHHHDHLQPPAAVTTAFGRSRQIVHYGFGELLDETSYWLVLGIILSGIVAALLPATLIEQYLSGEFTSMLAMLLIGIPIYTCASSSTPIAAALVLKGLNPGAALVFLLAGPATNLGSLTVLLKFLGARIVAIYLLSIIVITLLAGYTLNWIYRRWGLDPIATFGDASDVIPEWLKIAAAVLMLGLLLTSMRRTHIPGEWLWLRDKVAGCSGIVLTMQRFKIGMVSALLLLYLGSGLFSVQPGEAGIKLRFGEIVDAALPAGLHYRLPWPFESHQLIATERIRRLELGFRSDNSRALVEREQAGARLTIGGPANPVPQTIQSRTRSFWLQKEKVADEAFFLTGDGNLLDISFVVHYRVADPVAYAYTLAEPEPLIRSLALAALRAGVGRQHIDAVYTSDRAAIEQQVSAAMQTMLDTYRAGIGLVAVRLLYVHPPDEVHDAFRDVASAQEDKQHIINRAKTFAVEKVNLAQGEAAAMLEDADAFKEEQLLHAEGDSTAFSVQVGEYRKAPGLTKFRLQLEAIETTLPQARKFLRPGAGDLHDFDLWLLEPPAAK